MLQRGLPVSDVLYYYGDNIPNYTQIRDADPVGVGTGYDYDVITADALIDRVSVKDGRLVLPDGTNYRMLMLPRLESMPIAVLRKLATLTKDGAEIAGQRPTSPSGLLDSKNFSKEFDELTGKLWNGKSGIKPSTSARPVLESLKVSPDFSFRGGDATTEIRYIHRRDGDSEIYFIASRGELPETINASFRISGKAPELWNPVTGEHMIASAFEEKNGVTSLPLTLDPCGSTFVVFRKPAIHSALVADPQPASEISGPWDVSFDTAWGGPDHVSFDKLSDWSTNKNLGIRNYSGTATYRKTFSVSATTARTWLDLGDVRELAEVRLNGKSLGILWSPPFRVEITSALKSGENQLEIDVVNFWPNRVIGDAALPVEKRLTRTNVLELKADTALVPSGLLGPVRIFTAAK